MTARFHRAAALMVALVVIAGAVWIIDAGALGSDDAGSVRVTNGLATGITPRIGEPAPEFSVENISGASLSLSDLRGRPVIVNFWASWCPPCRGEMPDLDELARQQSDAGLTVLAVNLDEERVAVQRYATALDLSLAIGIDRGGQVSALYNVVALPTSFFIDRQGIVRDLNIGPLSARSLRTKAARVLE